MALNIKSSYSEELDKWILETIGDIDIVSSKALKEVLVNKFEEKAQDIILDFTHLDYIDSTGLGIIIGACGRMKESGKKLTIIHPKESIKRLLTITGLDKIFMQ